MRHLACVVGLVAAAAAAACHPAHKTTPAPPPTHAPVVHHAAPVAHHASPRSILSAYLDATFAGRHRQAWALLSAHDQETLSRDDYVKQWLAADRVSDRLDQVQETHYQIGALDVDDDRARARVQVTTVLGSHPVQFILRFERGHWRVAYRESWKAP